MFKKYLIAIVVVFIAFILMDFLVHGLILSGIYKESVSLWRSQADRMSNLWIIYVATFLKTIGFVYIYYKLISNKTPFRGLWYGLVFGFSVGIIWGYSTYAMQPIPYSLALGWFFAALIESGIGGWITGLIIKES